MKTLISTAVSVAVAAAVALWLRFQVVEPEALAHLCGAAAAPWWCALRAAVVAAFASQALAIAAVAVGVLAIATRRPGMAQVAACLGVAGLLLYAVEAGAVAFLLGLLALARPRAWQARGGAEQEA